MTCDQCQIDIGRMRPVLWGKLRFCTWTCAKAHKAGEAHAGPSPIEVALNTAAPPIIPNASDGYEAEAFARDYEPTPQQIAAHKAAFKVDKCKSCFAPVVWGMSPKSQPMPFDAEPKPTAEGGIYVLEVVEGRVFARAHEPIFDGGAVDTYRSHFKSCPFAAEHSKKHDKILADVLADAEVKKL